MMMMLSDKESIAVAMISLLFLTLHYLHLGLSNVLRTRIQSLFGRSNDNDEMKRFWSTWFWGHCLTSLVLWILLVVAVLIVMPSNNITNDISDTDDKSQKQAQTPLVQTWAWHMAILAAWRPLNVVVTRYWPRVVVTVVPHDGGPLGRHWAKVVDITVGAVLYSSFLETTVDRNSNNDNIPLPFRLGRIWDVTLWGIVVVLVILVNGVLQLWTWWKMNQQQQQPKQHHHQQQSQQQKPKHSDHPKESTNNETNNSSTIIEHQGVADMVQASQGRALSMKEHAYYATMALANAICEEVSSRGLWRWAYRKMLVLLWQIAMTDNVGDHNTTTTMHLFSNVEQALAFGLWHYHGIPSGWTGVVLTTVYGLLMGALQDYADHGLAMPIVAHAVADYYIFAIVARQPARNATKKMQ